MRSWRCRRCTRAHAGNLPSLSAHPPGAATPYHPPVRKVSSRAPDRSHIYDLHDIPKEYRAAFASAKGGSEAIIGPGDSLVIPSHWWHRARCHLCVAHCYHRTIIVPFPTNKTRRPVTYVSADEIVWFGNRSLQMWSKLTIPSFQSLTRFSQPIQRLWTS